MATLVQRLEALPGARHISLHADETDGASLVTADLRANAADPALIALRDLRIQPEDIALVRLDTIGSDADGSSALVWADVLGRARLQARRPARYFALMAAAGVIAALAVVNDSATLVVGAMAIALTSCRSPQSAPGSSCSGRDSSGGAWRHSSRGSARRGCSPSS